MKAEWEACSAVLRREVVPALGCTDPVAIALAAANAAAVLGRAPERLELTLSRNMLKNATAVGIPGTGGASGVDLAAALGAFGGDPGAGLETLAGVSAAALESARRFVADFGVPVQLFDGDEPLYIEARAFAGPDAARVVISGDYARIVVAELNGRMLGPESGSGSGSSRRGAAAEGVSGGASSVRRTPSLSAIAEYAREAPLSDLSFLLEAAAVNGALSDEGLAGEWGLGLGKALAGAGIGTAAAAREAGPAPESATRTSAPVSRGAGATFNFGALLADASARTAAAVEARMAGCPMPAMTNSGSGNQGIVATLPVVAAARLLGSSDVELARALAASHLVAIHMRERWDRLSAMCGTIAAGSGAACGIVFLLGGGLPEVEAVISNVAADLTGMLCDGAKPGCALKAASAVRSAVTAAMLAVRGVRVDGRQGVVDGDAEATVRTIGRLSSEALKAADAMTLGIMLEKGAGRPGAA